MWGQGIAQQCMDAKEDRPRQHGRALLGRLRLGSSSSSCSQSPVLLRNEVFLYHREGQKGGGEQGLWKINAFVPPGLAMSCWLSSVESSSYLLPSAVLTVASKPIPGSQQGRRNGRKDGVWARDREHPHQPGNPHNPVAVGSPPKSSHLFSITHETVIFQVLEYTFICTKMWLFLQYYIDGRRKKGYEPINIGLVQ